MLRFSRAYFAVILDTAADCGQQVAKIDHNAMRTRQELAFAVGGFDRGIRGEKTAGLMAKPIDDPGIAGHVDDNLDAVEWITRAGPGGIILRGFLAPLVDESCA